MYGKDDWLNDRHVLLFMDDTVVLTTSRQAMEQKLSLLKDKAHKIRMLFHPSKCQYLTINTNDETPIRIDNVVISETKSYTYLGATVSDNKISQQVANHMNSKKLQLSKFTSFLTKKLIPHQSETQSMEQCYVISSVLL